MQAHCYRSRRRQCGKSRLGQWWRTSVVSRRAGITRPQPEHHARAQQQQGAHTHSVSVGVSYSVSDSVSTWDTKVVGPIRTAQVSCMHTFTTHTHSHTCTQIAMQAGLHVTNRCKRCKLTQKGASKLTGNNTRAQGHTEQDPDGRRTLQHAHLPTKVQQGLVPHMQPTGAGGTIGPSTPRTTTTAGHVCCCGGGMR